MHTSHLNELVKFDKSLFLNPSRISKHQIVKWKFDVFSPIKSFRLQEVLVLPQSNRFFWINLFDTKIECELGFVWYRMNRRIFQIFRFRCDYTLIAYAWNDVISNSLTPVRHTFGFFQAFPGLFMFARRTFQKVSQLNYQSISFDAQIRLCADEVWHYLPHAIV